ncbi:AAA domain-containing protein [Pseudoalteromonas sp. NEC-BIFX-2020_015]|uniref:McrB family protein n=1 Tax=Pseudoalteromonas sp. NEC-BIFX-2020_015 TaxID=2729544 RepID=UPI001461349A|nr:AAA family ATPase [Pseudoalteromonas sp. NEC-BIFX-2020_015]NMR25834.1 AAA domain-containing protein [Pseudoalteromonas sp. NEC-BIFX-2020_015]
MDFFIKEHFDLLNKWQGKKSNPKKIEQKQDYPQLKDAYAITERWARALQKKMFPSGTVKIRKSPINQGGNFFSYNWAKIYPFKDSPEYLAYTVGIDTDCFTVKIDTVNAKKGLREKYLAIRGEDYAGSGIVSILPSSEGLQKFSSISELVDWSEAEIHKFSLGYDEVAQMLEQSKQVKEPKAEYSMDDAPTSLNTILYGPPGTGKTYHTVEAAVKAAEPSFQASSRKELKAKYDSLVEEKRVRFVTFHQSYGYEEFVEGLKANSNNGEISYDVEAGIFKQICEDARQGVEPDNDPLEQAIELFKAELEETSTITLKTLRGNDFDVQYHGNTTFRVFPEATSHDDLGKGYPVSIDNIRKLYRGLSVKKIYNSSYVKSILNHIKKTYKVNDFESPKQGEAKNFVLVIDEINRGNISKIFGELITLIEESKRSGEEQNEALEVVLPNSGEPFSVPENLYLIGTMNTADRSLAMMDTALRRRFDFVEMMPRPELFHEVSINGIDLEALLSKMNQRIEVLYDREHTLGHAFFIPIKDLVGKQDLAFGTLKSVFKNKIIPLLEEYFFEDWNKIRLVLGDNQKVEELQFVREEKQSFDSLFGNNHGLNNYQQEEKSYTLLPFDNDVWNKPEAYIRIYKAKKED